MQRRAVRLVARKDIPSVQLLIERCVQLYMTEEEVEEFLFDVAQIEPRFTRLVWQRLEEENREFFHAYHLKLRLKEQIMDFNKLLDLQAQLMMRQDREVLAAYDSYVPHVPSIAPAPGPSVMQQPNVATDGGSLAFNAGLRSSMGLGLIQGSNDQRTMKSEAGCFGSSATQEACSATDDVFTFH